MRSTPYCAARSFSRMKLHLFDANEIVEAGELVEDLARDQRGLGRADRLREEQQRDRLLNRRQGAPRTVCRSCSERRLT